MRAITSQKLPGDVCLAARWGFGGCRAPVGGGGLRHGALWCWDPAGKQADKAGAEPVPENAHLVV